MKQVTLASSIISWSITASILIWAVTNNSPSTSNDSFGSTYAFNVIDLKLAGINDPDTQLEHIKKWKKEGKTAQTAAIKTLCTDSKERMSIIMDEDTIEKACRIIRTADPISLKG